MKQFSQQLHKKATSTVKLQAAEKRELKERVVAYMEYHPLPAHLKSADKATIPTKSGVVAEPFITVSIPFARLFKMASLAAVFVVLVVPFVAERAVPGDTLYAIKVQFNEEVRGSLTFDTFQKVEWETERLNRRIAEARLLASEGRLTEAVEAEVADAVRVHTANAQREIAELRTEDADAATIASITLDTTLEVQSTSLKGEDDAASALGTTTIRQANLIADAIDQSRSESEGAKASSTLPAYGKLIARVEQNTTRIYELLSALQDLVPADELSEVTRRVEDTDRAIMVATEVADLSAETSRQALVEVLQRSQRLIIYMAELMVVKTVDIETLIPIVLTEVEESTKISSINQEVATKTAQIKSLLALVEDESTIEKVEFALAAIEVQTNLMASSTEQFKIFYAYAADVIALIDDSLLLLDAENNQPVVNDMSIPATSTPTTTDETQTEEAENDATTEEEESTSADQTITQGLEAVSTGAIVSSTTSSSNQEES